jgi:SAM-dependent methyltransferase
MTPISSDERLRTTRTNYDRVYENRSVFLRWPADWVLRFHNMALRSRLERGARVLDYGCGSGNNAVFLALQGYHVTLADVTETAVPLVRENFRDHNLLAPPVEIVPQNPERLPWADGTFDFVLSNQVLYYLPSESDLKRVVAELARVTRPGGIAFFTMIGPRNHAIQDHTVSVTNDVHEIDLGGGHRLSQGGRYHEFMFVVRDEDHLKQVFDAYTPMTTGYFDQSMLDMRSNFHWIFAGQKA